MTPKRIEFRTGACTSRGFLTMALALAISAAPVMAAPQAPSEPPPPPPQTTAPGQPQTPSTGQPQRAQPGGPGQSAPTQKPTQANGPAKDQKPTASQQPIPQKDNPDVKAGSKADVEGIGNRGVANGGNFYSLEREIALGKGLAQEVERSAKLVDDPIVSEYVNRVGQNLVRNSDAKVPFTIKVIDSDVVNAFALPGGFFYVNSGLLLRADSEAELAGVMAHEIAHVAARHGTKNATKGELAQLATIPLIMLGPGGWAGYGLYEGLQFVTPVGFLK